MGMINEFKQFALKGNVMDLAVGVVIGAAFGKIVTSFVSDVIMPPLGLLLGNVDFSKLAIVLREPAGEVPGVTLRYGAFINTIVDFLIVALAIFVVVKQLNRFKRAEAAAPSDPTTKVCPYCQSTIAIQATRCPQCTSQL